MARRTDRLASGRRDRLITIEQRPAADAVDTEEAPIDGPWTTLVDDLPAAKEESSGRERFVANQLSAQYDTRWEINYRPDMDPDLVDVPKLRRLTFSGRVHDIVYASEVGRRRGVELYTLARSG
jgi:head-tail adaptor